MKEFKIFWKEIISAWALEQMEKAMNHNFVVTWALMPDSHEGYSLPIGGVVATKDVIVPAWVGYDIGCGMCAFNTWLAQRDLKNKEKKIFDTIYKKIPVSHGQYHERDQEIDFDVMPCTPLVQEVLKKHHWKKQIGTLWGGNHFIEIGHDEDDHIWVVIHSGSRGIGYKIAEHYMNLAKIKHFKDPALICEIEEAYDRAENHQALKLHNPEKYEEVKGNYVEKQLASKFKGSLEGHYGFHIDSPEGKDYFLDMNFGLYFALENRKRMMAKVVEILQDVTKRKIVFDGILKEDGGNLINRNHNHCVEREGLFIHRKGATHSEAWMWGIIPWNMKDGSFVVVGKGNPESLYSSSHWAGRKLSRKEASAKITLEIFQKKMKGIFAKVENSTIDESPFAYKSIFNVMEYQSENVEVKHYLKPLINIKW